MTSSVVASTAHVVLLLDNRLIMLFGDAGSGVQASFEPSSSCIPAASPLHTGTSPQLDAGDGFGHGDAGLGVVDCGLFAVCCNNTSDGSRARGGGVFVRPRLLCMPRACLLDLVVFFPAASSARARAHAAASVRGAVPAHHASARATAL